MICTLTTTGFPGATFSPSRYRTVVENLDWVLMTWGGCLSTTRVLRETSVKNVRERSTRFLFYCLWVKLTNFIPQCYIWKPTEEKTVWLFYLWIRTCRSCPNLSWSSGIGSTKSISSCLNFLFTPSSCSHLTKKNICKKWNKKALRNTWSSKASKNVTSYALPWCW